MERLLKSQMAVCIFVETINDSLLQWWLESSEPKSYETKVFISDFIVKYFFQNFIHMYLTSCFNPTFKIKLFQEN